MVRHENGGDITGHPEKRSTKSSSHRDAIVNERRNAEPALGGDKNYTRSKIHRWTSIESIAANAANGREGIARPT